MNDVDDALIAQHFAAHTSTVDDSNWPDVERRVRPRRPGRVVLALAAAGVVGALIITPALGIRGAIFDLFGRNDVAFVDAPSAGSVVKRDFADMSSGAPKGMDPQVVPGQTRLAGTFQFGASARRLWVAPTTNGSFCYLIEGISGGCHALQAHPAAIAPDGGFVLRAGEAEPAMDVLAGKVFGSTARTLLLTFEDGNRMSLPFIYVSPPINAGFFAFKPTARQQVAGHRPTELLLVEPDGKTIARRNFNWVEIGAEARMKRDRFQRAIEERAKTQPR
jgi:hypothetical protein